MTEYTEEVIELKKTNKPNQYIKGHPRNNFRETIIIWNGMEGPISAWAIELNFTVNSLRNKIKKLGLCEKAMQPSTNKDANAGAARTQQALFEHRCERILSILDENPGGVSTSYLQSLIKIKVSHINRYLREMEKRGDVSVKPIASKNVWFSTARPVDKAYHRLCFMGHEEIEVQDCGPVKPFKLDNTYLPKLESLIPINNQ